MTSGVVYPPHLGQSEPMGYGVVQNTWPEIDHIFQHSAGITESAANARSADVIIFPNPRTSSDIRVVEIKVRPYPALKSWGSLCNAPDWPRIVTTPVGTAGSCISGSGRSWLIREVGEIRTFDAYDINEMSFNMQVPPPARQSTFELARRFLNATPGTEEHALTEDALARQRAKEEGIPLQESGGDVLAVLARLRSRVGPLQGS